MDPNTPSISPEDQKERDKAFRNLPIQNQLETLLTLHGKERLHHLFLSDDPRELVKRMPELELFLTVKEIGEKDAIDLLSLTSPEQFQYLLDLDFWKKDRLNSEKIIHWMKILLECGEEKIVEFIRTTDREFTALLLKKFLRITKLEGEPTEVMDRTSLFTIDREYFVIFKIPETRPVFQQFLELLYRTDQEEYRRLMESLIWELESDLEEFGYRTRKGRLADHGFPEFEEALEIYRFLDPDGVKGEEKRPRRENTEGWTTPKPVFHLTFQSEGPFFSHVLSKLTDPAEQERLRQEMAALYNKAIVAEPVETFTLEELRRTGGKAFHYLNLGLEYLSDRDEIRALEILQGLPAQKIFQSGVGATLLLRKKAEAILRGPWFRGDRQHLVFLDPPYLERFEGILKRRPALFRGGISEDFKDLKDFFEVKNILEMAEAVAYTLEEKMNLSPQGIKEMDLSRCHPREWRAITFSTLFLTSLANQILDGTFRFEAIDLNRLNDLVSRIFRRGEEGKGVIAVELKRDLKVWLDAGESSEDRKQRLLAFWDFCLDLLEEELGRIPPDETVDPRFIKGLLFRT